MRNGRNILALYREIRRYACIETLWGNANKELREAYGVETNGNVSGKEATLNFGGRYFTRIDVWGWNRYDDGDLRVDSVRWWAGGFSLSVRWAGESTKRTEKVCGRSGERDGLGRRGRELKKNAKTGEGWGGCVLREMQHGESLIRNHGAA